MLLIPGVILVMGTALLLNATFPLRGRLANGLAISCLIYGQIVLLAQVLSELAQISAVGFMIGHSLLFGAALWLWNRQGRPKIWCSWRIGGGEITRTARQHRLLTVFAIIVLLICAANLALSIIHPSSEHDEMNYHLPRAYFWAENGTARHYDTPDIRQIEFPPNASFTFLWIMLLSGGVGGLNAAQWIAGLVAAGGTMALARAAGFKPAPALLAGLIFLTTTNGIQQMASGHNDLLTAAPAVCFIYFALRFLQEPESPQRSHALAYSGLNFGLLMGAKYTVFFLLPGAGIMLAGYALIRLRGDVVRAVILLGISAAVGFVLFGAYNYALNWLDFGNPIASEGIDAASSIDEGGSRDGLTDFSANLTRYLYQLMDWSILPGAADSPLFRANLAAYQVITQGLPVDPELPDEFDFVETGLREPYFSASGYGAVVYAVLLVSPFVMLGLLIRRRWLPALLIALAWSWLLIFAWLSPWSPWKPRYFHIFMPMLLAGVLPLLYTTHRRAWLWLNPLLIVATVSAGWATTVSFGRREFVVRTLSGVYDPLLDAGIAPDALNLLRAVLPEGATIGLAGFGTWPQELIRHVPDFRYQHVSPDATQRALDAGDVQAVLASRSTCRRTTFAYFPTVLTEHVGCLFVPDPQPIIDHLALLDSERIQTDYDRVTLLPAAAVYIDGHDWSLFIPTHLMEPAAMQVAVLYNMVDAARPTITRTVCGGQTTLVNVLRSEIHISFDRAMYDPASPVHSCVLTLADTVAADITGVRIAPASVPPPHEDTQLQFGDDLLLLSFDIAENQPLESCGRLYVGSWWRVQNPPSADYIITMVLADSAGVGQGRHDGPLAGRSTSRLAAGDLVVDRRFVPIPCTPDERQYDLLVGLYDSATGDPAPIYLSNGAPLGSLAYLTTITLPE